MNATPETLSDVPQAPATRSSKPLLIAAGLVILLFAGTYLFAWLRARSLSQQYLNEANASYEAGDYLEALVGYQEYDENAGRYINRGGYFQVVQIWVSRYAWPIPPGVQTARERINEIVNQRITIEDAEQFIQMNTGRRNPYMGIIYLRLGELYEQDGDIKDARDIYESFPQLFPNQPDLIDRAQEHLNRLNSEEQQ